MVTSYDPGDIDFSYKCLGSLSTSPGVGAIFSICSFPPAMVLNGYKPGCPIWYTCVD